MQAMPIRIFLILTILTLLNPSSLQAAPEQRTALVIGNSAYSSGPLKNPVNDATDMAKVLKQAGFSVTLKKNASLRDMMEAIEEFGNTLKRGGIGLFYYAGHGVQVGGINYLLPIGARISKEGDVRYEAVDAGRVLAEMENANNGLNIVLLDACRDNPFTRSFRSATRGLAIVTNAPTGTFISYSTGAGQVARDGEGRNSPYTKALLEHINKPDMSINRVFMNVRSTVMKETGQVPWELSSLVGDFYFHPRSATEATPATVRPVVDYAVERRKIEEERELLRQRAALEEEKRKLEEERQRLAKLKSPAVPSVTEIGRDGRYIAYRDGTVLDTKTNLMWAARDNVVDISWDNAKQYCESYRGGGYADWRMPTQSELWGLYDAGKPRPAPCNRTQPIYVATELIDITCFGPWAYESRNADAVLLNFHNGVWFWPPKSNTNGTRVIPVRTAN
jgi:hypothetical protein